MVIDSAMPAMMGSLRAKLNEWPRWSSLSEMTPRECRRHLRRARYGRRQDDLEHRHVAGLRKVQRKPGEKEPGQGIDAVLADVDADQHAIAEEHFDGGPGERVLSGAGGSVCIDQAAAALDGFDLGRRDARMVFDAEDVGVPDRGEHATERAQEPKQARQPAMWISHAKMGAKMGSAKYCDELKMAEARPRSEVGNQEATMRPLPERRGLEESGEDAKDEDRGECSAGGQVAREGREKGTKRPGDDGDA